MIVAARQVMQRLAAALRQARLVTVREHLIWTHMIASNSLTKASILELPPSHPLARLLKVFTFRANEINTFARDTLLMKDARSVLSV